ncbi:MAG: SpoIID/LytB domain-containing protein [Muribaculaceae bacterium]|nr:SpoIID/LytB domain-containing protein [Muribaculaceae bacterium]
MKTDALTISVGIPTLGAPVLEKQGDLTLLKNMLIGKDFHWQQTIEALLPGEVEINDDDVFKVVNRLPLEKYLECVVGSEMNPEAPEEFLKAHSVISRSWALGKIMSVHDHSETGKKNLTDEIVNWEDTCDHVGFNVCSDDHCQRYQGIQPIPPAVKRALKATEGEVICSPEGKLIDARFSKCCGGKTELFSTCWQPEERDCLESFEDPWCNLDNLNQERRNEILKSILKDYDLINSGGFRWETIVTAEEIESNLHNKFGRDIGKITDLNIISRGASGRIYKLQVNGTKGTLLIGKELMIRRLLASSHLYSSWFDIENLSSGEWLLKGRGWGHGVGLCQIGAARMALEGFGYKEILSFYYPGAHIKK